MRRAVAVSAVVMFAACVKADAITAPDTSDVAGSYSLRSINGVPLPFLLGANGTDSLFVLDDTYTLSSAARFSESIHTRRVQSGRIDTLALSDSGTFTRTATGVRMIGLRGLTEATIKVDTLQLDGDGITFVYRK